MLERILHVTVALLVVAVVMAVVSGGVAVRADALARRRGETYGVAAGETRSTTTTQGGFGREWSWRRIATGA